MSPLLKVIQSEAKLKEPQPGPSKQGVLGLNDDISGSSSEDDDSFEEVDGGQEETISIEIMPNQSMMSQEDDLFADIFQKSASHIPDRSISHIVLWKVKSAC